ncbi:hypothetical protein GQ54DRAFT_264258 [Martensiomyces pterosporus]|nr:hypothetical protein GQ54DRAFT_264258 [Martensiomyces pterosporus]
MASLAFTFFDAPDSSKSAQVFVGVLEDRSATQGHPIAYTIRVDGRSIGVYASPAHGGSLVLSGTLEGMTKSHATVSGFGGTAQVKKEGHFKGAWAFTDFQGSHYAWDVKFSGSKWRLLDSAKQEIASFDRTAWKSDIEGTLHIHLQIPDDLLALVLLTNKLVHNRVKSSEQASANIKPA